MDLPQKVMFNLSFQCYAVLLTKVLGPKSHGPRRPWLAYLFAPKSHPFWDYKPNSFAYVLWARKMVVSFTILWQLCRETENLLTSAVFRMIVIFKKTRQQKPFGRKKHYKVPQTYCMNKQLRVMYYLFI